MEPETDRHSRWKLKKINKRWFLDVGGKLVGMNILNNAKDVYMEDNIIFADDKMYQLTESDNDVLITEIQDICRTELPLCEKKEPVLNREKEESNAKDNDHERERAVTLKGNHEIHLNVSQDAIHSSSTGELTPTEDNEYGNKTWSDSEKKVNDALGSDQYVPEEDTENDYETLPDLEQEESFEPESEQCVRKKENDYEALPDLGQEESSELESEQYVRKKGKIKGFFKRIKEKIVQRRPAFNQKEWPIYLDMPLNDDCTNPYSDFESLRRYSSSDDVPTVPVSDNLSFRKGDNIKLYGETRLWCNMDKKGAEEQLLIPDTPSGTFLIRPSGDGTSLVLSVRDYDPKTYDACVKHCRIQRLKNGGFYIRRKRTFDNMLDLIFYYRNDARELLYFKSEVPDPNVRPLVQFKELEVSRETVKLFDCIGHGTFGDVYAGKLLNTVDVAVKTNQQHQMSVDDFLAEAKLMHHLRHKKLVQLMAVCTKSEPIYIITELMINGTLLHYLRQDEGRTLDFNTLADIASQIADGMAYMETEKYVHGDLRAANIFVGDHNEVKVADFGLSKLIQGDFYEANEKTMFPIKWTAPEAAFDRKFSIKSDVWSYGVLLYELITFGKAPFPGMNGHEVLNRVCKGFRMQKPTGGPVTCPDPYYEIMLHCWNRVADRRPTFAYLQDFFNNYM